MARKRTKKLNIHDIHKNNDVEVSHAIQKIKENERKYTAILVLIFMSIFVVLGYFSLRVNYHYLSENNYLPVNSYSTAGEVITLTTDNILSDQEGLLSLPYHYQFSNDYTYFLANNCYWTTTTYDSTKAFAVVSNIDNTTIYGETKTNSCKIVPVIMALKTNLE